MPFLTIFRQIIPTSIRINNDSKHYLCKKFPIMRILIINTAERIGGAAIAASRLMDALKNNGIKTKMLVRNKQTEQLTVIPLKSSWRRIWQFAWERIVIWIANGFTRRNLFAVDIDDGFPVHGIEMQQYVFSVHAFGDGQGAAVPVALVVALFHDTGKG